MLRRISFPRSRQPLLQSLAQPRRPIYHRLSPRSPTFDSSSSLLLHKQLAPLRRAYSTVIVEKARRPSRIPRVIFFSLLSLSTFLLGFSIGLDNLYPFPGPFMGSMPTDEETLSIFEPQDEITREIEEHIRNHPLAVQLRNDPAFIESRPHLKLPKEIRGHNLTGGTLSGPDKIVVPPYYFNDTTSNNLYSIFYLGQDVSGHPGMVHGGLIATLMDETFARCCFPALPNKVAVTAMLNIEYKKPAMTGSFFVLKATTTKVEGRKAWVEGTLETLVGEGEEPQVLASAKALFIEPKGAKAFTSLYKVP